MAIVLGSSLPALAFVPHHKNLAPTSSAAARSSSSSSGSRLPSSASYAADQPDSSTTNGGASSALKASAFAPPAPGRSATNDDDGDQQEDAATAAARTLLASKTEQVATLRAAQAEQLERISELTSNLANVHGDTDKLYTDLVKSQADLVKGLEEVTKLISEVSDATGTLTEVEVQRMEAMTALEDIVGSAALEEEVAIVEEVEEEEEEVIVNSSAAVEFQVSQIHTSYAFRRTNALHLFIGHFLILASRPSFPLIIYIRSRNSEIGSWMECAPPDGCTTTHPSATEMSLLPPPFGIPAELARVKL